MDDDLLHRLALATMAGTGLALLLQATMAAPADGLAVALLHRDLMMALLGLGLLMALFTRALRLPVVAVAMVAKASLVGLMLHGPAFEAGSSFGTEVALLALLGFTALVLVQQARREARWHAPAQRRT